MSKRNISHISDTEEPKPIPKRIFKLVVRKPVPVASKPAVVYIYVTDVVKMDETIYNEDIDINETIIQAPPNHSDKSEDIIQESHFSLSNNKTIYSKRYFYDVTQGDMIMLAIPGNRINVLTCSKEELLLFLSTDPTPFSTVAIDGYFTMREMSKSYIDTNMIIILIKILHKLLNITKINIIERSAEMEDNGFTDRVNFLIRRLPLQDVPDTRMSIGIFTHGAITGKTVPIPDNVNIKKQNVSAYGCITITNLKIGWNAINTAIGSLVNVSCVNQEKYLIRSEHLKEKKPMFHSDEGTCRLFEGQEPFIEKLYSGGTIVFAMIKDGQFKCLNLWHCTTRGFSDFFSIDYEFIRENLKFYRERPPLQNMIIKTNEIFDLVKCARDKLHITEVHIYDKSCNVILARSDQPQKNGFLVGFNPNDPTVRFGGTKCKKRKTKCKRRKTKHSHKN